MKRLMAWTVALAIAVLFCGQVLAASSAELVRVFVQDGTLYSYVAIEGTDVPITKAEAKIGTQVFSASSRLETVQQAGFPISYLLLVDNSTSMPSFRADVTALATGLAEASGENTSFSLATFGDDFTVVAEDISTENLSETMQAITYEEDVTRLHTCIGKALDYFESIPRAGNELRCLVILSDAVQYDPAGGMSYEALLERLGQSDVMLHSIGFGSDAADLERMGALALASGGTHQVIEGATSTATAAVQLSAVNGHLLVTGFDIRGCTAAGEETVSITFASDGALLCSGEAKVDIPQSETSSATPSPVTSSPGIDPAAKPLEPTAEQSAQEQGTIPLLLLIIVAAVLVVTVVLTIRFRRKKTPAQMQVTPIGIYMRLEVLGGELTSGTTEWSVTSALLIGRDSACDIAFDSQLMSPQNTRVFMASGAVYLEDLGSQNGTLLNGNRISTVSGLHSGDEISIGDVVFRLKF